MRRGRLRWWTAAAVALVAGWACSGPPEPILIEDGRIVVENRTARPWRNVRVTVNDHFFGGAPLLEAGGRLHAPLSQFQTGFGERFDRRRMSIYKIEVAATDDDGNAVALEWLKPRPEARRAKPEGGS